jgi:hypothetical protein
MLAAVFLDLVTVNGDHFGHGQIDALCRHFASRLYKSRYFSLELRYAAITSGRTKRCEGATLCR